MSPSDVNHRLRCIAGFIGLALLVSVVKLGALQLTGAEHLVEAGRSQRLANVKIPGYRGAVIDRNGDDLAVSLPRRTVAINMRILRIHRGPNRNKIARQIASTLGLDPTDVQRRMNAAEDTDQWVYLGRNIAPKKVAATTAMLSSDATKQWLRDVPATDRVEFRVPKGQKAPQLDDLTNLLDAQETTQRVHPAGESALRVIGKLSADGTAAAGAGIERLYNKQLTGEDGLRTYERGTGGQTIAGSERLVSQSRPGTDVQLTLDRTLQYQVERILARGASNASARRGVAIVGRPSTGELLAVASVQRDEESGEMRLSDSPVAFDSTYQAGSVFKLVTIAAATQAGLVHTDTAFSIPWRIQVADRIFQDHDEHATQRMTVKDILAKSSNVGTIKIAQMLGKDRLHQALSDFGFGRPTNVGSPSESAGLLPAVADWTTPDLAASAIGTHVSGTPIQIWSAYNVIANKGRYVAPRLVDATVDASGRRVPLPVSPSREVVSPATAAEVTTALRAVVDEGTARQWSLPGYPVAAKTGTSRMPSPKRVDRKDGYVWEDGLRHYVTTFTGFFPVDDPQVSITVMLDDTPPGSSGSATAGPVFSDLAHLSIRELGIAPSTNTATPAASASSTTASAVKPVTGPVRAAPAVAGSVSATERAESTSRRSNSRSSRNGSNRSTSRSVRGGVGNGANAAATPTGGN